MSQLSGAQRSRLASEVHGLKDQLLGLQSHDGTMTVSGLGSVDYGDPLAMHNSTVANHKAMKVLQVSHQRGILGLAGRALERSVGSAPSGPVPSDIILTAPSSSSSHPPSLPSDASAQHVWHAE